MRAAGCTCPFDTDAAGRDQVDRLCPVHGTHVAVPRSEIAQRSEAVDHPAHYGGADSPYEAIKVIDAWGLGFSLGNAVKYIARHRDKGTPVQDLEKARWYLEHAIRQMREGDNT